MPIIEFIGGPLHGQFKDVPDDVWTYQVTASAGDVLDMFAAKSTFRIVQYVRRKQHLTAAGGIREVFFTDEPATVITPVPRYVPMSGYYRNVPGGKIRSIRSLSYMSNAAFLQEANISFMDGGIRVARTILTPGGRPAPAEREDPGAVVVSTVFLRMDHSFGGRGRPVLFETMVFNGSMADEQDRYHTPAEAIVGHQRMVDAVMKADAKNTEPGELLMIVPQVEPDAKPPTRVPEPHDVVTRPATEEESFRRQIDATPDDWTLRLVFADWLGERGDPREMGHRAIAHRRLVASNGVDKLFTWYNYDCYKGLTLLTLNSESNVPHPWLSAVAGRLPIVNSDLGHGVHSQGSVFKANDGVTWWIDWHTRETADDALALAFIDLPAAVQATVMGDEPF